MGSIKQRREKGWITHINSFQKISEDILTIRLLMKTFKRLY